jgi:hypothetical protein
MPGTGPSFTSPIGAEIAALGARVAAAITGATPMGVVPITEVPVVRDVVAMSGVGAVRAAGGAAA